MSRPIELFPGLYQITQTGVNMFLLETRPDELTLIDAGFPGSTNAVINAMQSLGKVPHNLKHILITHADLDHIGSLAGIATATGATVYASALSTPYIHKREAPPHLPAVATMLFNPMLKLMLGKMHVDQQVEGGDTLDITDEGIDVISAPGHTPDNVVFYWRKHGVLFAADLLQAMRGKLAPTQPAITWDVAEAHKSIERALAYQPSIICVGHGNAVNIAQQPEQMAHLEQVLAGGAALAAV